METPEFPMAGKCLSCPADDHGFRADTFLSEGLKELISKLIRRESENSTQRVKTVLKLLRYLWGLRDWTRLHVVLNVGGDS